MFIMTLKHLKRLHLFVSIRQTTSLKAGTQDSGQTNAKKLRNLVEVTKLRNFQSNPDKGVRFYF